MRSVRNLIPLAVLLSLGVGVACKKPAPAPPAPEPAPVVAPAPAPVDDSAKKAEEEAARRKAEAEAEAARKAAAEAARLAKFKADAEAALKDINFDFDKSDIRDADKAKLQAIADFMKAYPEARIQVAGGCDERGTVEYNLALGERRAYAARDYLASLGVADSRMTTISYGKEKPKVQGKDEESWMVNRYGEFTLQQ